MNRIIAFLLLLIGWPVVIAGLIAAFIVGKFFFMLLR